MKVIKRDGRVVDYDKNKIKIAIEKANKEVPKKLMATKEDINSVIEYIEELDRKRILVEDIQDIIEEKLMELGKYQLAKKYIVYRYTRALVRKSNTTDKSILGLIRESNKDLGEESSRPGIIASMQRDLIAGEVSKDLAKRILLPDKITKAWEDGILHFHNADYFVQPVINSCFVKIGDMLDNGTVINNKLIESPKSFYVACIVMSQIIGAVASNQYGEQYIDLMHLGKYLNKSKNKFEKEIKEEIGENIDKNILQKLIEKRVKSELESGVQTIFYQINTFVTTNGREPKVTLILHNDENNEYYQENLMIIEEIKRQRDLGIKNEKGEYEVSQIPKIISFEEMQKLHEGEFNQGIVSINLPQIAIIADGNEEEFWKLLDERLELCKEALMCRYYALVGTLSDISPIHWQYGAIARLKKGEKIDELLYSDNSNITLTYVGTCQMSKLMKEETERNNFENKVIQHMEDKISKWRKETKIGFVLDGNFQECICRRFSKIDREKFGTIEEITDSNYCNK